MSVLIVEDSRAQRRITANILLSIGYKKILEAENGIEALEILENEKPDFIITDWNMPEMDGLQLVKRIRENEEYDSTPIIMLTTRGSKEDVLAASRLGINTYITKPFSSEILEAKIAAIKRKILNKSSEEEKRSDDISCFVSNANFTLHSNTYAGRKLRVTYAIIKDGKTIKGEVNDITIDKSKSYYTLPISNANIQDLTQDIKQFEIEIIVNDSDNSILAHYKYKIQKEIIVD